MIRVFLLGISSETLLDALWHEVCGATHLDAVRALLVSSMAFSAALGSGTVGPLIDVGIRQTT